MRYIDEFEYIDKLTSNLQDCPTLDHAILFAQDMPEAIVRCSKCRWRGRSGMCKNTKMVKGFYPRDDWFCADGERKQE